MRSNRKTVCFRQPFRLTGLDGEQMAGRYDVLTDEEEIPGLSFIAWRRSATSIRLPSLDVPSAQEQWTTVDPDDLDQALARDGQSTE